MCLAGNYLTQFQEIIVNIKTHNTQLNKTVSKLDKEDSTLYHELEKMDVTQDTACHFCLLLQTTLWKRRVAKDELRRMSSLRDLMVSTDKQINSAKEKYTKDVIKSDEIRRSLNVTFTIEDIGGVLL